jgi:hypothetical protein
MDELPAIDRIPGVTVLGDVVAHRTRPWGGEPVPVPLAVSVVLWLVLAADVAVGGWLGAVRYAAVPCSGWPCTVATWGHPGFLLAVSAVSAVLLVTVAAVSRGLTGVTPVELGVVLVGAAAGVVAVAGVLALLLGVAAVLGLAGRLLLMVIERI